jgi:hypothetical protein
MNHGRTGLLAIILFTTGCLISNYQFEPTPFRTTSLDETPDSVIAAFVRNHPDAQIERVEHRRWAESDHYRVIFRSDDELREIEFRQDGSMIEGTDRTTNMTQ